jgi:16S rRNA C967 or C1407 C5-methylase (RsmB/RsmF family)/NOL1/NOP2/fmu family ribosome biogenesis protein
MNDFTPPLPDAFVARMRQQLGADYPRFEEALRQPRITSLRHHALKARRHFEQARPVPWCEAGEYLAERPQFASDPHIFAGAYYVQEASSMFLEYALRQLAPLGEDLRVLDLCASPGGKSTLIQSLLTPDSLLVSNELVSKRVGALIENLTRWGCPNAVVTSNHAADFGHIREYFDVIVVDAPCSGEGMFRKDPRAREQWSEGLVASCAGIQRQILEEILPSLKPGGLLVYSTCTFAPDEDEGQLAWLAQEQGMVPLRLPDTASWGVEELAVAPGDAYGYRFYPHRVLGEGFFLSAFRKGGEAGGPGRIRMGKKLRVKLEALPKPQEPVLSGWVSEPERYAFLLFQDHVYAVPAPLAGDAKALAATLNVCFFGVKLGRINGKKFIPDHHLAVSLLADPGLPALDLAWGQAIAYLQKQELQADTGDLEGWALARYQGNALGWLKVLPNRINNFYPAELRLKWEIPG